jgi:hypothetical protein
MLARALTYPLAALIVPVVWRLRGRPPAVPALDRHPRRAALRDRHRRQRARSLLALVVRRCRPLPQLVDPGLGVRAGVAADTAGTSAVVVDRGSASAPRRRSSGSSASTP